jgi:hypothetical protein
VLSMPDAPPPSVSRPLTFDPHGHCARRPAGRLGGQRDSTLGRTPWARAKFSATDLEGLGEGLPYLSTGCADRIASTGRSCMSPESVDATTIAGVVSALAAVGALWFAWQTVRETRTLRREDRLARLPGLIADLGAIRAQRGRSHPEIHDLPSPGRDHARRARRPAPQLSANR